MYNYCDNWVHPKCKADIANATQRYMGWAKKKTDALRIQINLLLEFVFSHVCSQHEVVNDCKSIIQISTIKMHFNSHMEWIYVLINVHLFDNYTSFILLMRYLGNLQWLCG